MTTTKDAVTVLREALEALMGCATFEDFVMAKSIARAAIATAATERAAIQPAGEALTLMKAAERLQDGARNFNASTFTLGSPEHHAAAHEYQAAQDALLRRAIAGIYATPPASPVQAKAEQSRTYCHVCDMDVLRHCNSKACGIPTPAATEANSEASELPSLPKAERELIELHQPAEYTTHVCTSARFTADQMHAYGELCRDTKLDESDGIYRAHVEDWATKAGWTNKAEGAFEFAQRTCYRQGWNDAVAQLKHERRPAMKLNDTQALGYVDGRAVFVGAELEQLTRKGWVRHNAQESWRGQSIDWKNDFRWPAEGVKPLFKLDRLDSLIHQLVNVTSDLHRSIQPAPNYGPKDSIRHLSPCDECAGTGSMGPDINPAEMDCEVCGGTGNVSIEHYITDSEIDMLAINNCLRIEVVEGTALRIFDLEHQRKFARAYGQLCRDTTRQPVAAPSDDNACTTSAVARQESANVTGKSAAPLSLHNDLNSAYGNTTKATADHLWALGYRKSAAPVAQGEALTDEQLVGVLHALGIDTRLSVNGFGELQVDGTNLPTMRAVVMNCINSMADSEWPAPLYDFDSDGTLVFRAILAKRTGSSEA